MFKQENTTVYENSTIKEYLELSTYCLISILLPFILSHPQILVGAIVNALLVLGAINVKGHKILPLVVFPSIGVLVHGAIFGNLSNFLIYLIPFIWVANYLFIFLIRNSIKKFTIRTALLSSVAKSAFLFIIAFIMYSFNILPVPFLLAMGPLQLGTAILGFIIALPIQKIKTAIYS